MSQSDNRNRSGASRGRTSSTGKSSSMGRSVSGKSASSRSGQAARMNAATQARKNTNHRKRSPYDPTKIIIGVVIVAAVIACIVLAVKFAGKAKAGESSAETTPTETELQKEVSVDGISITGLSREDAKAAILKEYTWGMKVTFSDQEYPLENMVEDKINAVLEEIYTGEPESIYNLDFSDLDETVDAEVKIMASKWDIPAKNGSISGFDKENGKFLYAGEQMGRVINQDKLAADIKEQLNAKNFTASIEAESGEVAPEISEAQAKEMYKVIGTYTTTTTANKDRNTNIQLAAESLNGLILQPNEEFSFNKATGERAESKGYKPAGAYLNGILVEEPGGGVCQVSSTLYNAVIFAGLNTTERHPHSYEPSYVTPGEDAMVSFGSADMKFVNTSTSAIAIRAFFADRKLKISIVGIPLLEEGVELSMKSTKTRELDPPAPTYEEDQTLEAGVEKVVLQPTKGSVWETKLVTKKNGEVIKDESFHNSTYRGKPATIKRNTSGVVIPATTVAPAVESTTASVPETTAPSHSQPETKPSSAGPGETTAAPQPTTAESGSKGPGIAGPGETPAPTHAPTQATTQAATQPTTQAATQAPASTGGAETIAPNPGA